MCPLAARWPMLLDMKGRNYENNYYCLARFVSLTLPPQLNNKLFQLR